MQRHSGGWSLRVFAGRILWLWCWECTCAGSSGQRGDRAAAIRLFLPTSCQYNQNNSLAPNKIKCRIQKPSFPPAVCLDPIPWSWAENARGGFILVLLLTSPEWEIPTVGQKVQLVSDTDGSRVFLKLLLYQKLMPKLISVFFLFWLLFSLSPLSFCLI